MTVMKTFMCNICSKTKPSGITFPFENDCSGNASATVSPLPCLPTFQDLDTKHPLVYHICDDCAESIHLIIDKRTNIR